MLARLARTEAWDGRRSRVHTEAVSKTSRFKTLIRANIMDSTTLLHTVVGRLYALSTLRHPPSVSC